MRERERARESEKKRESAIESERARAREQERESKSEREREDQNLSRVYGKRDGVERERGASGVLERDPLQRHPPLSGRLGVSGLRGSFFFLFNLVIIYFFRGFSA